MQICIGYDDRKMILVMSYFSEDYFLFYAHRQPFDVTLTYAAYAKSGKYKWLPQRKGLVCNASVYPASDINK